MCGINLILNFPGSGERAIQKMMEATLHRGPDHSSWTEVTPAIYLAGSRLKIHDLGDTGNQPLVTEDGKSLLVWNGALYNYQELKNALLDKGILFKGKSDAEVLIHWLRIYGLNGVKQLQGMFAFVFVDRENGRITIGRDPYGQKPLYYFHQDHQWIFSSEARAIVQSGLIEKQIDGSQFLPYFYSRHSFPDRSFFLAVRQVLPGQIMVLDFLGHQHSSLKLVVREEQIDLPHLAEFREKLVDAVAKHFYADVPVGIFLSGGADSSLLLHTWYRETGIPLHTFTVAFDAEHQQKYSDPKYARALSAKFHCAHHEVRINPEIVLENWDDYISSVDQPIGDSAGFLTWMVARKAKEYVKVLVSGAGADELFSGYDRHQAFLLYLNQTKWFKLLAHKMPFTSILPRRLKKLLNGITDSDHGTYLNFSSLQNIPADLRHKFLCYYPKEGLPYKAALSWDREYYLVNDILRIHDNATMAHGMEGRAPFLDESLVVLSNSLSEAQHRMLKPKQWIKQILKEDGLGEIAERKKLGFGLPLKEWIHSDALFRSKIFSTLRNFEATAGRDFPEDMRKLARHPEAHVEEGFLQIWNLFILASWKERQGI
jgi:asparagine synthase (glutamine-hydrolysing)